MFGPLGAASFMDYELNKSLLHLLHSAQQKAEVIFSHAPGKVELTPRQFVVMATIARNEGLSQTDIVNATGIDRSTLADIVKRLLRKGVLVRKRTKEDARAYAVRLTAHGQTLLAQTNNQVRHTEKQLMAMLPPQARSIVLSALLQLSRSPTETDQS
jgi:DNA-binding MarR family transcriptional regulator